MAKPPDPDLSAHTAALKAHTKALTQNTRALKEHTAVLKSASAPIGCCTIAAPDVPDKQFAGITEARCNQLAGQVEGGVPHWIEGSCA